eukprot:247513-Rhodomonas_salina.1
MRHRRVPREVDVDERARVRLGLVVVRPVQHRHVREVPALAQERLHVLHPVHERLRRAVVHDEAVGRVVRADGSVVLEQAARRHLVRQRRGHRPVGEDVLVGPAREVRRQEGVVRVVVVVEVVRGSVVADRVGEVEAVERVLASGGVGDVNHPAPGLAARRLERHRVDREARRHHLLLPARGREVPGVLACPGLPDVSIREAALRLGLQCLHLGLVRLVGDVEERVDHEGVRGIREVNRVRERSDAALEMHRVRPEAVLEVLD